MGVANLGRVNGLPPVPLKGLRREAYQQIPAVRPKHITAMQPSLGHDGSEIHNR